MARKLVVSVVKTVVGARREALDLFFGFRTVEIWSVVAVPGPEPVPDPESTPTSGGP